MAIDEDIAAASSVNDVVRSHAMYIDVAVHYLRPKQVVYIREALQGIIREVIEQDELDLETDPCVVSCNRNRTWQNLTISIRFIARVSIQKKCALVEKARKARIYRFTKLSKILRLVRNIFIVSLLSVRMLYHLSFLTCSHAI